MLVCESLLMPGAQIADLLLMYDPHMTMQIRPTDTRYIASTFWTIILQQKYSVLSNIQTLVLNPDVRIRIEDILFRKVLVFFRLVVCKDHKWRWSSTMRTILILIQRPHPQ